ncbi:bifunctional methylenetetrahydrofolate dehydrogenase/methenyltetrahydrofolate cyclohydrolase FolD [Nocardia sp. NPDC051911]|uniref:bifunctional methylenetetrahydrofolate dehydrogenase/methenyltetrahydrofolate cyclohydrolase FolD n=1 Tax=Nocardia sp. NPDC051911 TaxID=3154648 RepID=UPI00344AAD2F
MTTTVIDGKLVAQRVRDEVASGVAELTNNGAAAPGLATVLIGDDPSSEVYVRNKRRACTTAGMRDLHRHLPGDTTQQQAEALIEELANAAEVTGILVQLPLPHHLDADRLLDLIPPDKDVDGLTTLNTGRLAQGQPGLRPCTPAGVIRLLEHYDVSLRGAHAVVVGRSVLVGRPMAQLLTAQDATVTLCHSWTKDLDATCREADVLVVAAGVPNIVGPEAVRPGAVVIDVGIHRTGTGLCGDVAFERVVNVAGMLTPVPGGVGPMTIAMLLSNTLDAARRQ